jgi:hypothetical protein
MFEDSHKLHCLKSLKINGLVYYLCYFWNDESIFSSDYRRCFVLLPSDKYSLKVQYKISELVESYISFSLAKDFKRSKLSLSHFSPGL